MARVRRGQGRDNSGIERSLARDLLAESRIWWGAARYGEAEAKKSPLGARANRSFLNERGDFMGLVGWA